MTNLTTYPFKSIEEYIKFLKTKERDIWLPKLLEEAKTASSWGVPSHESAGYSQSELCTIINKLVRYIESMP